MKSMLGVLAITGLTVIAGVAQAEEMGRIAVGSSYMMKCTGPYYATYKNKLVSRENGIMRWEFARDGKAGWREKAEGMLGSHVNVRQNLNDGKGVAKWDWEADTASFDPLTPGSTLSVTATQRNNKWTATEKETIRIEERKTVTAPILGEVDAIKVTNGRTMTGQFNKWTYESSFEMWVATATGAPIEWSYKDNKGSQDCVLSELDLK